MKNIISQPHPLIVGIIAIVSLVLLFNSFYGDFKPLESENIYEGEVVEIKSELISDNPSSLRPVEQTLTAKVRLPSGETEKEVFNDYGRLKAGDRIYVQASINDEGERFYVIEVNRNTQILILAIIFVLLSVLIGGIKGLRSVIGLLFSFVVIFYFIIPRIVSGADPVAAALLGSIAILAVGIYSSHGFNRHSMSALIGIGITLLIAGYFSDIFVTNLNFTGVGSDESLYLKSQIQGIDLVGILAAGIIIAVIGVLDDIALTQASIVRKLKLNTQLAGRKLFREAMSVGRDHISALINTLVLAYTGASLPLLLLLYSSNLSVEFVTSGEVIAQEIVRTLISSSALILAVPITTAIAVALIKDSK